MNKVKALILPTSLSQFVTNSLSTFMFRPTATCSHLNHDSPSSFLCFSVPVTLFISVMEKRCVFFEVETEFLNTN